ncbi:MAG: O-antigen ligase family protein [Firmicutes bacterium]|nr:O-antigen ligase family protein [Bacillota bacterium]
MDKNLRRIKWSEILLFVVVAIVPIIVRNASVAVAPELAMFHNNNTHVSDVFSFHKSWVLMLCAGLLAFHALTEFVISGNDFAQLKIGASKLVKNPVIIMVLVYLFFVIISNLFSAYTQTALWGVPDRREGLFVQLAYMTIFISAMFHVKDDFSVKVILVGLMASSLVMGAIGFSQFINMDFFATEFASWLVFGIWGRMGILFSMSYGTNFNPNTFGLVTAMLFPLLFAAAIYFQNKILRALFILAGGLMTLGVVGSRSVGGLIGATAAVGMIALTLLVHHLRSNNKTGEMGKTDENEQPEETNFLIFGKLTKVKKVAMSLIVAVAIIGGIIATFGTNLSGDIRFTMERIFAIFEPSNAPNIEIEFTDNQMAVTRRAGAVTVNYTVTFPVLPGVPQVQLADGTIIEPTITEELIPDGETIYTYLYEFPTSGITSTTILRQFNLYMYQRIPLMFNDDNILHMVYRDSVLYNPNEPIPAFGFEGWETWGSNRGYIFSRTIPMLPQSLLIGQGSDTFVLLFPNHDMVSKLRYFGNSHMIVDKAHNLYLQTAVTTGVISALALIGLFGFYIITTFISLINHDKKRDKISFWLRLGLLASVSAFSVSSLSTDSTVSSTPMFWIIIGLGFAINRIWGNYAARTS